MLALVFDGEPHLRVVRDPVPAQGEAVVRVLVAGICGTDLELLSGYRSFRGIPGHEMVGVVEEAPDPDWVGARVVSEINVACGGCRLCREGLGEHCENRQVLGIAGRAGVFAERVVLPLENLHRVPDAVFDEEAVWTEPLAAAIGVTEAGIPRGDPVLVLGDGRLGALVALALQSEGFRVELVGKREQKLRLLETLGVAVRRESPQPIYPWVVEATGSPAGVEDALAWTRPKGTVILKSTCREPSTLETWRVVVGEIRLFGSRCGEFPLALRALRSGQIPVRRLITKVLPFSQAVEAVEECADPDVFKILLDFRELR